MKKPNPTRVETPLADRMELNRRLASASARRLRVAGLFAGIGGLELGLHRSGHSTELLCEIEPGAVAVLEERFPGTRIHKDVCELRSLPTTCDMVVGGFPCQDLSQAGKTVGIEGSRSGLVGEVFRLLRKRRTPWVMLENVPFMLQLSRGRAMEVIVATLEDLGYRWAYRVIDTRSFGIPQRRERVYMLASRTEDPRSVLFADDAGEPEPDSRRGLACGFYWTEGTRGLGWAVNGVPTLKGGSTIGIPSPPAIVMPNGTIVTPDIRDAERLQGFVPDWTVPTENVTRASHRWKLVGNAVTVDVAQWIGERLLFPEARELQTTPLGEGDPWPRAAFNIGKGRFAAAVSAFPVQSEKTDLHRFLRYPPRPLSAKATAGFLSRAEASSLRFQPGFLDAVREHLDRMHRMSSVAREPQAAWG